MFDFSMTRANASPARREAEAALLKFKDKYGHPAMRDLLLKLAGTPAMSEIPEDRLSAVVAATKGAPGDSSGAATVLDPKAVYDRWNAAGKRPSESQT